MDMNLNVRKRFPWWLKIVIKVILSRLPIRYQVWKKLRIFERGRMNLPSYAHSVFMHHFEHAKVQHDFTCLELGPGDTLYSALIGRAKGATRIILIDIATCASRSMKGYNAMYAFLLEQGYSFTVDLTSFDNMLKSCNATYLTCGVSSLRKISSASVDFVFSQAVLEHIRKRDFLITLKELRRIMKPKGIASHVVDLRDHLRESLHNLRFSEKVWESEFLAKSGFYTNRIRFMDMLHSFEIAGFDYEIINKKDWMELPISNCKLHKDFRKLPLQDLRVSSFSVVLSPR